MKAPLFASTTKITVMSSKWVRLFEYQRLRVGDRVQGGVFEERHWQKLSRFLTLSRYPCFQILPDGIQFGQYVGVLQVDELTIEIVPKTDRSAPDDAALWQNVLIDLLRSCRLWRGEWIAGGRLDVKPGGLLEWYCRYFLQQTEGLLRQGLQKSYDRQSNRRPTLRGRLLLHKQVTETRPVFWTDGETFNYNHPYNHWLKAALELIIARYPDEQLRTQARMLYRRFPALTGPAGDRLPALTEPLRENRYLAALTIARLLLNHFSPVARHGEWPLMALLFDMNALFEEYIARQLEKHCPPGAKVRRQVSTPFWNRRSIRPDLILDYNDRRFVVDTKWKEIPKGRPAMEDIRQIYVYNEYFAADQGILLYPQTEKFREWPAIPFAPVRGRERNHSCRILAAPVVRTNGTLHPDLGKILWEKIVRSEQLTVNS